MKFHGNKRFAFGALVAICALALAFAVAPSSGGGVQDFAQSPFATVVKASAQNGDQDLDVAAYDDAVTRSGFEAGESAVADDPQRGNGSWRAALGQTGWLHIRHGDDSWRAERPP